MTHKKVEETKKKVVVITALDEELDYLFDWNIVNSKPCIENDLSYYRGQDNPKLALFAVSAKSTGGIDNAVITEKAINKWHPDVIALIGICAGRKDKVEIGDVIIPNECFHYQIGAYKQGVLQPELRVANTIRVIIEYATSLQKNHKKLQSIHNTFPKGAKSPTPVFNCHIGPMASADLLVRDNLKFLEAVNTERRTIALDMESYAFMHTSELNNIDCYFVVKSVTDYGDNEKNDDYRDYAKYTSTKIFIELIRYMFNDENLLVPYYDFNVYTATDKLKSLGFLNYEFQFAPSIESAIEHFWGSLSPTQKQEYILMSAGKTKYEISNLLNVTSGSVTATTDFVNGVLSGDIILDE